MLGLLGLKVVMNSKSFASSLVTLSWLLNRREKKPRRFTYVEATFRRGKQHHRLKLVETMGHVPSTALQLVINNPRSLQAVYQVDTETWIFFYKNHLDLVVFWWIFYDSLCFFWGVGRCFFLGGEAARKSWNGVNGWYPWWLVWLWWGGYQSSHQQLICDFPYYMEETKTL